MANVNKSAFEELIQLIKTKFDEGVKNRALIYGHAMSSTSSTMIVDLSDIDSSKPFMLYVMDIKRNVPVIPALLTKDNLSIAINPTSMSYTFVHPVNNAYVPAEATMTLTMKLTYLAEGRYYFEPNGTSPNQNTYYYESINDIDTTTWQAGSDYPEYGNAVDFWYLIIQ